MIDPGILLEVGRERHCDLIASAEAHRRVKRLKQAQRPARRALPGQLLRLLVTMAR